MFILLFLILLFVGPRAATIIWWFFAQARFNLAFDTFIWPILGIIFLPWTTLMYVGIFPGGITGLEWVFMGLAVLADLVSYSGTGARMRKPGPTKTETAVDDSAE